MQEKSDRELGQARMKNENSKHYLIDVSAKNVRVAEDIEKKAFDID